MIIGQSFSSTAFTMRLEQHLCHTFFSEKAYKASKHIISTMTYAQNPNFSGKEVRRIKLSLVIVNKPRHTDTIYTL